MVRLKADTTTVGPSFSSGDTPAAASPDLPASAEASAGPLKPGANQAGEGGKVGPTYAWRGLIPAGALAVVTVMLLTAVGPTAVWRHSGIAAGTAGIGTITSPQELRGWINAQRGFVVWQADGFESSIALSVGSGGYAFIVNGKADGSARVDAGTQVMLALIGSILHPNPRRSLVIGLGTGSSAGWLGAVPTMERVDVVELEPIVLDVARECRDVNYDVLNNPKVHIRIADAREVLLTTDEHYDVIASEPSNPFRAGIASLFTQEYYRAASDRLNDDGFFLQWLQAYGVDARAVRTVYATMGSVFPSVETWQTRGGDIVLVGAKRTPTYDLTRLAARIQEEPYRTALRVAWRSVDLHGFSADTRRATGSRERSPRRRAWTSIPTTATSWNSGSRDRSAATIRWSRRFATSRTPSTPPVRRSIPGRGSTGPPSTPPGSARLPRRAASFR
jgi:spermidine synthase